MTTSDDRGTGMPALADEMNLAAAPSRRALLRVAGALGAGSVLGAAGCASHRSGAGASSPAAAPASSSSSSSPPSPSAPSASAPPSQVPTRPFGKTGEHVSALALGGYFDALAHPHLFEHALALGVTYWETTLSFGAKAYGQFFRRQPEARRKVFLLAKTTGASLAQMDTDLQTVLTDAATSHVDFFIIGSIRDGALLTPEVQQWVDRAKAQGKIRHFGFSTHANMELCLELASQLGWIDGVLTTYNYRLMQRPAMRRAVDACVARGIAITAIKSQALETNPAATIGEESSEASDVLRRHLSSGHDLYQARLRAVWDNPQISSICSMMTDDDILNANARAALGLPASDTARSASPAAHAAPSRRYCAGCASICEGALPAPLPIADVMRYLMYVRSYGDRLRVQRELAHLSPELLGALAEQDYALAEQRCPEQLPIGRLMREARHS